MEYLLLIVPLALLIIGAPIAIALLLTAALYMFLTDVPLVAAAQRVFTSLDQFVLVAIPSFMLAGAIMERANISQRLIDFAMSGVGHYRAGLAKVTVITSMLFGGMSGAAAADSAAVGGILIPEMVRHKYPRPYSSVLVGASAITAVLIPPSIPLVFYGAIASVSISKLLLAGAIPGLLVSAALVVVVHFQDKSPERTAKDRTRSFFYRLVKAFPVLLMPLIILGGIFFGIVTATEAAVVAVVYGVFLGLMVLRTMNLKQLYNVFADTVVSSSTVMILIALASVYSWILTREQIPQEIAQWVLSLSDQKWVILILINLILLVVGCVLDTGSAMIIFVSVMFPVVTSLGIDPVHFGVIMVFNLAIGMITPPVGIVLMVISSVGKVPMQNLVKPLLPFFCVLLLLLMLITYIPSISLWLPSIAHAN